MAFFDDKTEVIEFKLTQHGKRLVAEGKMKPVYYSFADDGVLYDSSYAGLVESQNQVKSRILNTTPRLKVQPNYGGIETEFARLKKHHALTPDKPFSQTEPARTYSGISSLGTSGLNTQMLPAWSVKLYGKIGFQKSTDFITGSTMNAKVPQLTTENIKYGVNILSGIPDSVKDTVRGFGLGESLEFEAGEILEVVEKSVFIEIEEVNAQFSNENFDIELFLVETPLVAGVAQEILTPLFFTPQQDSLGSIYVEPKIDFQEDLDADSTMAAYYLSIELDQEISHEVYCKYIPTDKRRGLYGTQLNPCKEAQTVSLTTYQSAVDENDLEDC